LKRRRRLRWRSGRLVSRESELGFKGVGDPVGGRQSRPFERERASSATDCPVCAGFERERELGVGVGFGFPVSGLCYWFRGTPRERERERERISDRWAPVPAVLLPHGVEEHPEDHHVEAVVFEGQPPPVAFVGDPVGWFRERASWPSKASEIRSVGAGADRSRERASSMGAGARFSVERSKGVRFRSVGEGTTF
jgi:hypothetical protein